MKVKSLKSVVKAILKDSGFDPKVNKQSNPKFNTDRASVSMALLIQLHETMKLYS